MLLYIVLSLSLKNKRISLSSYLNSAKTPLTLHSQYKTLNMTMMLSLKAIRLSELLVLKQSYKHKQEFKRNRLKQICFDKN